MGVGGRHREGEEGTGCGLAISSIWREDTGDNSRCVRSLLGALSMSS